jgi:hypothetical protein
MILLGQVLALPHTYFSSRKTSGELRRQFNVIEDVRTKTCRTRDYTAPAPELDGSTTVPGCKGAKVKHNQKSRRGKSCSTRTMVHGEGKGPARHAVVQQLQPYDCDASESILIGSG